MRRRDGDLIRNQDPFVEIIPYIMERRSDAQNYSKHLFCVDPIDQYLREKRAQGIRLSYLDFFIAAYVRLLYLRPELNRFIMNNRTYQRRGIHVSMAIKRSFREDGEETTVKFTFTGEETIFEVAEIVERAIAEAKTDQGHTDTDKLIRRVMSIPAFLKRFAVRLLKWMDRVNLMPQAIIDISPFHTSLFFTHLKSINTDYIYHHLYDFGTTGIFVALGKFRKMPVAENGEVVIKNMCQVGYTTDERICDGVYFARTLRLLESLIKDPALLETKAESVRTD